MPHVLGHMKGPIKINTPDKFPEESISSSHFRDHPKLPYCQKQSFWTYSGWFIMEYSPKCGAICDDYEFFCGMVNKRKP